ncbi:3-deoxy-8-phosphooctulonate synthase [Candidatus Aminicenantes bacterium AC-335-A11]|jgi:2-dehydro-3-deoxyphosphooctonate aldolase (KDO 8-P synthase)|nr:3-deoxy-8-phosphooctulonate synthase [SCandidatus Aminicenantes bacterium Aminicenantia_JdfR_composite]MCP2597798.1 3-deoxy-8-phosphooctulonate synthase [Candidatus Aminicenantes bacterium AC-335-L06]MCP2618479.1 3-deoxy-8-phosphooctulonate synthase [Candidatus Aminicenantes bacterium AC-335-A11]MCP2620523.1 3-deoxy-8-phosphooctulonate synthase [Candidatus Aminicenantes bacterium AC-334-E05]
MSIETKEIELSPGIKIGGRNPLFLIAGPCVIESEHHVFFLAQELKKITDQLGIPFIFKASYDKANRSSISSYRGPGLERGLKILSSIKEELNILITSDVHETKQVEKAADVLDVIQIPAFLCRQTDLLVEAAKTQKVINVKKGQFMAPWNMDKVIEKILHHGNEKIIITERGTSFGYNNLIFDVRAIPIMKDFGFPVVIDASHSVQKPGAKGTSSGGDAHFIPVHAKAGVVAGADGVFLEVHDNPAQALSDGDNSLKLNKLYSLLETLIEIKKLVENHND